MAINEDTGELRKVADNGANNLRPNISGDLISYESNFLGNSQIFVYRLDKGDTFRVTDNEENERLNDLSCDVVTSCLVTYIDNRNGNDGVFDASLTFIPTETATPLPAALPLFATGLGGLGLLSWRRKRKAQAAVA
jgi:Tol biopolymer transport system component